MCGKFGVFGFLSILLILSGCNAGDDGTAGISLNQPETDGPSENQKFTSGILPSSLKNGGYIDSVFMTESGERIYFIHSIYSPNVLNGSSSVATCSDYTVSALTGQIYVPGIEWNTDIYYVEWKGSSWSEPVNVGSPVNSIAMECCIWLNDDETEMIFNRMTDLDGDGTADDLGTGPTGNFRTTRSSKDQAWGTPFALPGEYGTVSQSNTVYRHDIHKTPSGNLYLWQKDETGDSLLLFGERNGGTNESPIYNSPVFIPGTTHEDTQIWANDQETEIVYNHRLAGQTDLYRMLRDTTADAWQTPEQIPLTNFEDNSGNRIWGEPTFDQTQGFMIFIRFDTQNPACYLPDIMYAPGNTNDGFSDPIKLN
jgi:hypothetical protein